MDMSGHNTAKNRQRAKLIDSRQSGQFSGQPCSQDLSSSLSLERESLGGRKPRRETLTPPPPPKVGTESKGVKTVSNALNSLKTSKYYLSHFS